MIREPLKYRKVSRENQEDDTVVSIGSAAFGGGNFACIAGPCAVESMEQVADIAEKVKAAGAQVLRGGAYKPRTSPYDFQGMKEEGIRILLEAKRRTGLPVVTEIMDVRDIPLFDNIDIIQVGARSMQNYTLLRELGQTHKPILLKRGMASTLNELLLSAEYIMDGGNQNIILCERGIRTFETATRNTMDISAIPLLKKLTHLPVIADPSHGTGRWDLVEPMTMASVAAGADGVMIEVHNDPDRALSDGSQSLTPQRFARVRKRIEIVRGAVCDDEY